MYKLCLALTIVLFLFNQADAQKTDREKAGLLGAVKTISSKLTNYASGGEGQTKQLDIVTYDKTGNETERVIYDDYGLLVGKEIRTFDASGNLLEAVLSDPKNAVMEKGVYGYKNNNLIQIVNSDDKGNVNLKQINTYDAKSRLVEETYYVADKAVGKTIYKYDAKGNISEASFYLADGAKAIAPIGPCLGAHKVTYSYNEKDKPTVITVFEPDGKVKRSQQYTYNLKGNIIEDTRGSPVSSRKSVYTYEYDLKDNWIKQSGTAGDLSKTGTKSPERKTLITREITYYQ